MERIEFNGLEFLLDGRAELLGFGNFRCDRDRYGAPLSFVQAQVAGENMPSHAGLKAAFSSEGAASVTVRTPVRTSGWKSFCRAICCGRSAALKRSAA